MKSRERCPRCGMPTTSMPEDAKYDELLCNGCHDRLEAARNFWEKLGAVPVNNDHKLMEELVLRDLGTGKIVTAFAKGCFLEVVWRWVEEEFDVSVHDDLMFPEEKEYGSLRFISRQRHRAG